MDPKRYFGERGGDVRKVVSLSENLKIKKKEKKNFRSRRKEVLFFKEKLWHLYGASERLEYSKFYVLSLIYERIA